MAGLEDMSGAACGAHGAIIVVPRDTLTHRVVATQARVGVRAFVKRNGAKVGTGGIDTPETGFRGGGKESNLIAIAFFGRAFRAGELVVGWTEIGGVADAFGTLETTIKRTQMFASATPN